MQCHAPNTSTHLCVCQPGGNLLRLAYVSPHEFYSLEHLEMPFCQTPSHPRSTLVHMRRDALPTTVRPSLIHPCIPVSCLMQCPAPNTPTHLCVCQPSEQSTMTCFIQLWSQDFRSRFQFGSEGKLWNSDVDFFDFRMESWIQFPF